MQDYDEYYPRSLSARTGTSNPTPIQATAYFNNFWTWYEIIYPYTRSEQVYFCPSGRSGSTVPASYNYGANRLIMRTAETEAVIHQAAVPATSKTFLLSDAGNYQMAIAYVITVPPDPTSGVNLYLPGLGDAKNETCGASDGFANSDCQGGRHFGGVNMAYADGHVKWLKSELVYSEAKKTAPALYGSWNPAND